MRCKTIRVADRLKWDLIEIPHLTEAQIQRYYRRTICKRYDFWGGLGVVLGFKQRKDKFFYSEWCFNAIFNSQDGWRFSPNELAVIMQNLLNKERENMKD